MKRILPLLLCLLLLTGCGGKSADATYQQIDQEAAKEMMEEKISKWITVNEIDQYDFCPADEEILTRLKTIE